MAVRKRYYSNPLNYLVGQDSNLFFQVATWRADHYTTAPNFQQSDPSRLINQISGCYNTVFLRIEDASN